MAGINLVLTVGIPGVDEDSGLETDAAVVAAFDISKGVADKVEQAITSETFIRLQLLDEEGEEYAGGFFAYEGMV